MNRILIFITFLFVAQASQKSFACLNEYRTSLDGMVDQMDVGRGVIYFSKLNIAELKLDSLSLWQSYELADADSLEYLSDYSVALIYLGHYYEAKRICHYIEAVSPSLYATASNLGTTYELLGQPDSALFWIKKSMAIYPQSHGGSEWIHVKILEAQINGTTENSESVLGLDFGQKGVPENHKQYNLQMLIQDISHQLRERLKFVSAPNKTVGNIYFDYGNVLGLHVNLENAIQSYEEAERFGFDSELLQLRKAEFLSRTKYTEFRTAIENFVKENLVLSFFLFLIGLIVFIWSLRRLYRRWKKRKAK